MPESRDVASVIQGSHNLQEEYFKIFSIVCPPPQLHRPCRCKQERTVTDFAQPLGRLAGKGGLKRSTRCAMPWLREAQRPEIRQQPCCHEGVVQGARRCLFEEFSSPTGLSSEERRSRVEPPGPISSSRLFFALECSQSPPRPAERGSVVRTRQRTDTVVSVDPLD